MHIIPVNYYQSKMHLRSGKTTAKHATKQISLEVQDVGDLHYKSFLSIIKTINENLKKLSTVKYLERIKITSTIFKLIQSKMVEICYLVEIPRYAIIKKTYLNIKDKIPQLIQEISEIMIGGVNLDDSEIEEISSCLNLLMKHRKQFK